MDADVELLAGEGAGAWESLRKVAVQEAAHRPTPSEARW